MISNEISNLIKDKNRIFKRKSRKIISNRAYTNAEILGRYLAQRSIENLNLVKTEDPKALYKLLRNRPSY